MNHPTGDIPTPPTNVGGQCPPYKSFASSQSSVGFRFTIPPFFQRGESGAPGQRTRMDLISGAHPDLCPSFLTPHSTKFATDPHFLGTQGVPLRVLSDGDIRGVNTLDLEGGADPIYFTLQGG